jgi:hypothetical protein
MPDDCSDLLISLSTHGRIGLSRGENVKANLLGQIAKHFAQLVDLRPNYWSRPGKLRRDASPAMKLQRLAMSQYDPNRREPSKLGLGL